MGFGLLITHHSSLITGFGIALRRIHSAPNHVLTTKRAHSGWLEFFPNIRFFFVVLIIHIFVIPGFRSYAGSLLVIDSDQQFKYAEALFNSGDFEDAAAEYKRFVYFFPNDERVEQAEFNIGMSFLNSRQYPMAINAFTDLIDKYRDTPFSIQSYIMISRCYIQLNKPDEAAVSLHNVLNLTDDPNARDESNYRLGWIYLENARWEKARSTFNHISMPNREKYKLQRLVIELDRKDSLIDKKNPAAAGFLSIIPGAGYLYCKRYKDALVAFIANAVFAYAAYESFDDDHYAVGGIFSFIGLGFYGGNILGATAAAHKYNRLQTGRFIDHLKQNMRINLSSDLQKKRVLLSVEYHF